MEREKRGKERRGGRGEGRRAEKRRSGERKSTLKQWNTETGHQEAGEQRDESITLCATHSSTSANAKAELGWICTTGFQALIKILSAGGVHLLYFFLKMVCALKKCLVFTFATVAAATDPTLGNKT